MHLKKIRQPKNADMDGENWWVSLYIYTGAPMVLVFAIPYDTCN